MSKNVLSSMRDKIVRNSMEKVGKTDTMISKHLILNSKIQLDLNSFKIV